MVVPARIWAKCSSNMVPVIARLSPGVSIEAAEVEGRNLVGHLREDAGFPDQGAELHLMSLREQMVAPVRPALVILSVAVGLVLLIACANVANLLLARGVARRTEIAVRQTLGAGRGRLIAQMLTESLLLGFLGGALGLVVASVGVRMLRASAPAELPRLEGIGIDATVVGFTLLVSLLTALLFGLMPALRVTAGDAGFSLKAGVSLLGHPGAGHGVVRGALTVAEIALSLMLLVGAGLLLNSFVRLVRVDPDYRTQMLVTAEIELPAARYPTTESKVAFLDAMIERAAALPGVLSASSVNLLPLARDPNRRGQTCASPGPTTSRPWASRWSTAGRSNGPTTPSRREWLWSTRCWSIASFRIAIPSVSN